jgi:hypothetical protein
MKFRSHEDHAAALPNFLCNSGCCYERYAAMHRGCPPLTFEEWREVDI